MAGAIKHMERSTALQQRKMTFGQHLRSALKRAAGKES